MLGSKKNIAKELGDLKSKIDYLNDNLIDCDELSGQLLLVGAIIDNIIDTLNGEGISTGRIRSI